MKKLILPFLAIVAFGSNASSVEQDGCFTKLKQVMKPEYPAVRISGYAIVNFDIKTDGGVKNIRSHKSMCLRHNRKKDTYAFSSCEFLYPKRLLLRATLSSSRLLIKMVTPVPYKIINTYIGL